jgi:hypothetical protein
MVTNSCTPASSALCASIGALPLGWRERRKRIRRLAEKQQDCDVATSLTHLLEICVVYVDQCRARYSAWGRLYYLLGLPAAIFAVLAGTAALATVFEQVSLSWMIAVPVLISAVLSAVVTFLRIEERRDKQRELMVGWMELGDRVQVALMRYHVRQIDLAGKARPTSGEAAFLTCLIELNRAKCVLLSEKRRAGPEKGQGEVAPNHRAEQPDKPSGTGPRRSPVLRDRPPLVGRQGGER